MSTSILAFRHYRFGYAVLNLADIIDSPGVKS